MNFEDANLRDWIYGVEGNIQGSRFQAVEVQRIIREIYLFETIEIGKRNCKSTVKV